MIGSLAVVLFFKRFTHFVAVVLLFFLSVHHTYGSELCSLPSDWAPGRRIVLGLRRTVLCPWVIGLWVGWLVRSLARWKGASLFHITALKPGKISAMMDARAMFAANLSCGWRNERKETERANDLPLPLLLLLLLLVSWNKSWCTLNRMLGRTEWTKFSTVERGNNAFYLGFVTDWGVE